MVCKRKTDTHKHIKPSVTLTEHDQVDLVGPRKAIVAQSTLNSTSHKFALLHKSPNQQLQRTQELGISFANARIDKGAPARVDRVNSARNVLGRQQPAFSRLSKNPHQ